MNRLKHIRDISVRASCKAGLPLNCRQHADVYSENHQLKSQLLRSNPLSVVKKNHGVDVRYSGQFRQGSLRLVSKQSKTICKQRSKTKSSVTSLKKKSSMHKKLPSENITKRVCHYSTCRNAKFNSNGINKRLVPQSDATINGSKNINRHSSFITSVEKHPRPYAKMIADYSESLYRESTVATRNDSFHFSNAVRKSPFSTFSVPSPVKTIVNVAEYSELSTEKPRNDFSLPAQSFDLCNRYNSINTIECYNFQHHGMCTATNENISQSGTTNDLKSDDQSYAKLVADCSKSMHNIPITSVLNGGLVPKEKVLARNSFESVTTPRKDNSTCTQNKLREITPTVSAMQFEKNIKGRIDFKENDWLKEMENVMSDLKNVTERKVAKVVPKMKESDILQSVDAPDNLSDRIHGFTELKSNKQKEKDTAIKKVSYQSNKMDKMEKRKKDFELQKHNYSLSSNKTSNLPQYFGNAGESSAVRKNSTHMSTSGNIGVLKQPQVKLRMVPSEKESIVSINVDEAFIGSSDPLNSPSKHLSVIVQSDQKENLQLTDKQSNAPTLRHTTESVLQHNNFGPMHFSISEDSAPVKQIEFSINGKPVSELKSITARTERLDVVSSIDKIEIRIPFAKDSNALDKTKEGDLSKGINSNIGQVLNLQISANFQEESSKGKSVGTPAKTMRYQYDKDAIKASSSIYKIPYLSNNFPKVREETFNRNNIHQYESSKQMNIKFNHEKNINQHKISDDLKIRRKTTENISADKTMTDISLIKEVNNVKIGSLNMRKTNTTGFSEANKYNKNESFVDKRVPSKIIPWWSSSDSFNKIRKKEDDHRPLVPPSNRNNHKAASNLNPDFIAKTLLSKPKKTSNSKILTKKTQSTNNATVITSDSSNTISYSNSIIPYEECKPTLHYSCLFRLKPNQENPSIVPEIIRNGLEAEDNQKLTANKDINTISGVKQMKSITLFKTDTMHIKDKHDISVKEKTSVSQRKIKALSSAQNLLPKRNHEKKNNYSLKQIRSIDDVSKNIKFKIEDILDNTKPIEKKDDILVDYSLKREMLSRKPTVILNRVQNPSPVIMKKDVISNPSTAEIVLKKIDKTMLTKQTEVTKEKLKTKMNILLKEKDLKNNTTIDMKALNKNDVKNIKEVYRNDFVSSSSSIFRNSPELTQTLKKQKQLTDDSIGFQDKSKQNLKSLLKADKNGLSYFLNMRISSGTVQRSEKLGFLEKVPLEEQNRPKSLSIRNTPETIQESEKLKDLTLSKLANSFKESSDTTVINKSPLQTTKQIQSKSSKNINKIANINKLSSSQTISNSTSNIKDSAISKNLTDKNISETITQSLKTKKIDMRDMVARIVTQNPKNKDLLSKDCEENFNKSGLSKGNLLRSAGPSRKQNDSVDFKSASSKTKSRVMSNNNCTYDKKLLIESFYSNFNRKNDIMSNSQSAIFKVQQNLSDVMSNHPVPTAIGCDGSWINMDRPEKNILYSAWLQRSENDIKKNGKLF